MIIGFIIGFFTTFILSIIEKKIKIKYIYNLIFSFFKRDEVRYRHGTCYKLFYGRIYCIQKDDCLGNFGNIFETTDKKLYENKVIEMMKNGVVFKNYT